MGVYLNIWSHVVLKLYERTYCTPVMCVQKQFHGKECSLRNIVVVVVVVVALPVYYLRIVFKVRLESCWS